MTTHGSGPGTPGPERRDWDSYSKVAVRAGLADVLTAVGLGIDAEALSSQPTELLGRAHRADLVFADPHGLVVHIEIQQRPQPAMGRRMAEYAVRIAGTEPFARTATDQVQILVQVTGAPMDTHYRFGSLTNEVRLLHLPSTPLDVLLTSPGLAPFALVTGDPDVVPEVVSEIVAVTDHDTQTSLVTLALFLAGHLRSNLIRQLRRSSMIIDTYEEMMAELRETDVGRDFIAEGLEQGLEQGRLDAVTEVLAARFATADAERVARTATRLVEELGRFAARTALSIDGLDT